ncbi:hypothetical protein K378_01467 [Streptomyces sp. Amel2xB2]|uniref:hypothetical protein n=1 Tax=Streptomyces sp. Amel2xB2 TaxID=1305829 RepID=UPI000DB9008E|nr:hypothetical protein [Streptomyces sp. Amel2xB2]RAJ70302.1 hypothetical protein K378_01467 [Streptomyces sp. Amel2xB2]
MKIFGREPALWLGMLAALLKMLTAFGLDVTETQQTLVNAFAAAAVGVILAVVAKVGAVAAAILQAAQAAMALFVGFGLNWGTEKQGMVMAVVAAALALYERTQVEAPVPPGIPAEQAKG